SPGDGSDGVPGEAGDGPGSEGPSAAPSNPQGSSEANAGAEGQTPLDPGVAAEGPANGAAPSETPLDELAVVEFVIPADLPGCGPPVRPGPAVDLPTGLVYYAGSNESCIGQFNPETGEFQAWPTATPDSYPHGLVVIDGSVYFTGIDEDLIGRVDPATG